MFLRVFRRILRLFWYLRSPMDGNNYISVILPLKLEWEPCYSAPAETRTGDRVKVTFAGKEYIGVVSETGISPEIEEKKIRSVISVENSLEKILPQEIELWRKVSDYYLCTIGEVYKAAYPAAKIDLEEARAAARAKAVDRKERIVRSIEARISRLEERGNRKEEVAARSKEGTKAKTAALADIRKIAEDISRTREALKSALEEVEAARKGSVRYELPSSESGIILSEAQKRAYDDILAGFKTSKPVLLHGVTGSGKTEIYISLAQETLRSGRNVLYLVPEIAISRQLEDRLYGHFGESLLTYHSGESGASRRNTAEIIRNIGSEGNEGNYMVLGTRSSLFLPHSNLGLIIVDEEHDSSYKQDSPAPRYNGRDTALMLNQLENSRGGSCNIVLGSATPSLEELYNCMTGRHIRIELKERYHGSDSSDIEIIDTKAERRKRGMNGSFSRKLIDHISETLAHKGQVLILRSRRAWAPALQCDSCGGILKCPHCNVSLSYHKSENRMTCHYCGFNMPYTGICPGCNGTLAGLGAGTQKLEEELAVLFPQARIARLDSDTAQNKSYETKTIRDFAKGSIDILVGTQIISKGFDFSNLSLVAVIAADSLLGIQDFRADEKALHLLEQFRGRCGRRNSKGTFVIQTSQPEHPIYSRLYTNDTYDFYTELLQERKDFGFPPYSRIVGISIRDIYEDRVMRMSSQLAEALRQYFNDLIGPYSPMIDKIADQHIRMIRINLKKDRNLSVHKDKLRDMIQLFCKEKKYDGHITIDVDPA